MSSQVPDHFESFECPACGDRHDVPRDPSAFHPTSHFRLRYSERDVPAGAIADCLGGAVKVSADGATRMAEAECADGRDWRFVFSVTPERCPRDGGTLAALTIYPAPD
jgi:rRNA maturation protein Nop10